MVESRPTQVFISYAHADSARLNDFRAHFGPVERGRNLTVWFDRDLTGGQVWNDEIRRQINRSDIFVCLVSAAFLNSDDIRTAVLPAIWHAVRGRGALLVVVILEACRWKDEFGAIQCLPKTSKGDLRPVNKWRPKADGYFAAASQAATAIERWLKAPPPPPVDPGPGVTLLVTQNGFDLAPDVPGPAERNDPLQQRILDGLREIWRELMADAGASCANSHPKLVRNLERYGPLIEAPLADLDVVALTMAGSALGGMVAAVAAPPPGSMTEVLEPDIRAGFETLLREHARLVMGFAEAREMIARDGLLKQLIDDAPATRQALHDVLEPMIDAPGLLTRQARDLMRGIDDGLTVAGVVTIDALASAVRQGGRSVASIARAVGRKLGSAERAITIATFGALLAGDPNLETYRAALSFLQGNAAQLLAFAAHQPELRRLIDWTMEQFGERERTALGAASDPTGEVGDAEDDPPPGFDSDEVHAMILRGEAPPTSWVPWITGLDFSQKSELEFLSPLSGLTALRYLDCSQTSVSDLAPLSGLTALELFDCSRTSVADLAPLSGLTALELLDCSRTSASDLAPLSGLTALQSLYCWQTSVSDLAPLSGLKALQNFHCWHTPVSDLAPLSSLTALQNLYCWGTLVSNLAPLSSLTGLQTLDCSHTSVSDLAPLSSLTALQTLSCSRTSVSDLAPLSGLTALQTLDCSGTSVLDLAPLSGLDALTSLFLADLSGTIANAEWFADNRLRELSLLGSRIVGPVARWAPYQIDPDGTVHDPDGKGSPGFRLWAQIAQERAKPPRQPGPAP